MQKAETHFVCFSAVSLNIYVVIFVMFKKCKRV